MVGCTGYKDFENAAVKKTKEETKCKEVLIALSLKNDYNETSYTIKTKACGKYYTYICNAQGGCDQGTVKCKTVAVESEPTKDAGELR